MNALTWQYYLGGVIQFHCDNSIESLNHAVQIVGYDMTDPTPFYIVRNSWGTLFGDKGYLYLAVGENVCGKCKFIILILFKIVQIEMILCFCKY